MDKEIYGNYWSPLHLESTKKPLLMAAEPRGLGKSTGAALSCIGDFYDTGGNKKFIYCRRTDDELKRTRKNYFDGALKIYNEFYGKNINWVYDQETYKEEESGAIVGYTIPLNLADKYKSATYGADGVRKIIYDEFILRRGKEAGYLGGLSNPLIEYDLLIGLYQTVDRAPGHRFLNETEIICLGNFANLYNPIMMGCNASEYVEHDSKFVNPKTQPWAVELKTDYKTDGNDIKDSYGYRLSRESIAARDYDNDGFTRAATIVGKLKGVRNGMFNCTYKGRQYGIWSYENKGVVYVSNEPVPGRINIAMTMEDSGGINQITAEKYRYMPEMQLLRRAAERGFLVFDSARSRNDILTYLDFTI